MDEQAQGIKTWLAYLDFNLIENFWDEVEQAARSDPKTVWPHKCVSWRIVKYCISQDILLNLVLSIYVRIELGLTTNGGPTL